MIALQSDCLLFRLANGESVPCSAEMISFEITGNTGGLLDPEVLRHASASRVPLFQGGSCCATPSPFGEFALALEKVLRGLGFIIRAGGIEAPAPDNTEPTSPGSPANPPTTWNCFSSRACAANSASSSASPRALCAFAACAAA